MVKPRQGVVHRRTQGFRRQQDRVQRAMDREHGPAHDLGTDEQTGRDSTSPARTGLLAKTAIILPSCVIATMSTRRPASAVRPATTQRRTTLVRGRLMAVMGAVRRVKPPARRAPLRRRVPPWMPSSFITVAPGALMPKRLMPMTAPSRPTYSIQVTGTVASMATRRRQDFGSTSSLYACGWRSNRSKHGMLTTRVPRAERPRRPSSHAGVRCRRS